MTGLLHGTLTYSVGLASWRVDQQFERLCLQDAYMALFDFDDALIGKLREGSADGFKFEAQVAANFFARHAQHEFGL